MKVVFEQGYRTYYTLEDYDIAKELIARQKLDEFPLKDAAEIAVDEVLKNNTCEYCVEILSVKAETTKNCGIWNYYFDGSRNFDVWIKTVARTSYGFIEVGAYYSDINKIGAEERDGLIKNWYIQYYAKNSAYS